MGLNIGNIVSSVKGLSLTDEQKGIVKKVVAAANGNKKKIVEELNKHNIKITEDQVDMVIGMADKL